MKKIKVGQLWLRLNTSRPRVLEILETIHGNEIIPVRALAVDIATQEAFPIYHQKIIYNYKLVSGPSDED